MAIMLKNTTADLVRVVLESDLYLLELLREDLVNVSSLARSLLPRIKAKNKKATVESISVAIRRYVHEVKGERVSKQLQSNIAHSTLATKNDVVHATYKRNNTVMQALSEIATHIKWDEEEVFLVNQGPGEITVIIDAKNQPLLKAITTHRIESTPRLTIISVKENISKGQQWSLHIPGVYAYFIGQLSRRGINIISVTSTLSQITFAFQQQDFMRAYEILQQCIAYFRAKGTD